jgi:hypothetical protein
LELRYAQCLVVAINKHPCILCNTLGNTPDIAFNDIGDLLDAEEAMFQELQEGWITYEEFDAFENYVLNHAIIHFVE